MGVTGEKNGMVTAVVGLGSCELSTQGYGGGWQRSIWSESVGLGCRMVADGSECDANGVAKECKGCQVDSKGRAEGWTVDGYLGRAKEGRVCVSVSRVSVDGKEWR